MSKLNPIPKQAPAFDPNDERYWDARDLEGEMRRMLDICHNCRMCVGYCGTFPDVFARVDRDIEKHDAAGAEMLDGRRLHERDRSLLAVQALLRQVPVHARTRGTSGWSTSPGSSRARRRSARDATASRCRIACSASRSSWGR